MKISTKMIAMPVALMVTVFIIMGIIIFGMIASNSLFVIISYLESDTTVGNLIGTVCHSRGTAGVKTW